MNDKIKVLEEAKKSVKPLYDELRKLESEVRTKRDVIATTLLQAANGIVITEDEANDDDFMEEFRDQIWVLADSVGMTWNGDYDYGDWTPGEEIEFWVPSTC